MRCKTAVMENGIRNQVLSACGQYLHDLLLVKVSKPSGYASLQYEKGSKMDHRVFSFDSGEEPSVGVKLEMLISPAAK